MNKSSFCLVLLFLMVLVPSRTLALQEEVLKQAGHYTSITAAEKNAAPEIEEVTYHFLISATSHTYKHTLVPVFFGLAVMIAVAISALRQLHYRYWINQKQSILLFPFHGHW